MTPPSVINFFFPWPPLNKVKFFRWPAPLSPQTKKCLLNQLYILYSNTVSFWHCQGITIHTTVASVTFNCILWSQQKRNVPACSEFVEKIKERKPSCDLARDAECNTEKSPQYCIVHCYCARFSRHQRTQMRAFTCTSKEISQKQSSSMVSTSMMTYIFYCIIIVYILSSFILKKECSKPLLCDENYDREKNALRPLRYK